MESKDWDGEGGGGFLFSNNVGLVLVCIVLLMSLFYKWGGGGCYLFGVCKF